MAKKKFNEKLLLKVRDHILAEPQRLIMGEGLILDEPGSAVDYDPCWGEDGKTIVPQCGTVGCIAGWTCVLGKVEPRDVGAMTGGCPGTWGAIRDRAAELLRIDHGSETYFHGPTEANSLFRVDQWPKKLHRAYVRAKTQKQRAKLVAQRIDQFIAEKREVTVGH